MFSQNIRSRSYQPILKRKGKSLNIQSNSGRMSHEEQQAKKTSLQNNFMKEGE